MGVLATGESYGWNTQFRVHRPAFEPAGDPDARVSNVPEEAMFLFFCSRNEPRFVGEKPHPRSSHRWAAGSRLSSVPRPSLICFFAALPA